MLETNTTHPFPAQDQPPTATKRVPHIQIINMCALAFALVLSVVAVVTVTRVLSKSSALENAHRRYEECADASDALMDASDYLTTQARMYVVTGDPTYLNGYLSEVLQVRRRNKAVETLGIHFGDTRAHTDLAMALHASDSLALRELYAMRLTSEAYDLSPIPEGLQRMTLNPTDEALSPGEKDKLAKTMVLGQTYQVVKDRIIKNVQECTSDLIGSLQAEETAGEQGLERLLSALRVIVLLLVLTTAVMVVANYLLIVRPMRIHTSSIENNDPLPAIGAYELRRVVDSYNSILQENHRRTLLLKREAETDALTGLLNRGSYDKLIEHCAGDVALILMDVDRFKQVNDTYGHMMGDQVLKKVADSIASHFRTTDYACRIGGDEFAVIMVEMKGNWHAVIEPKLQAISDDLLDTSDGLPLITLSIGMALSKDLPPDGNLYHAADKALYDAKHQGRHRYAFFGE